MKKQQRYILILLLFSFISNRSHAQLCTGSLGDPIVNITFGSGSNPGSALSAAALGYQYYANDCPPDGGYTIRNSTSACFGATWHSVGSDHTGNPGGYFMLVNASNSPGDFYVDTVRGLCSGTTFQFSAWLMNVLLPTSCGGGGNRPNITFSIERTDGTVIQQYNTGDISSTSSPLWKEYGFFFVTPGNVADVVLRLRNNAPGGCGNDLMLDDITFRPCGPVLTSGITGDGNQKEICEGDTATVFFQSSISSGFTNPHFQWQHMNNGAAQWTDIAGANASTYSVFMNSNVLPGEYYYRITATESVNIGRPSCRVASQVLKIVVNPRPPVSISSPGSVCAGDAVAISASGGNSYQWQGPSGFNSSLSTIRLDPVAPLHAGRYYVTVLNASGCSRTDSTDLVVNVVPVAMVTDDTVQICEGGSVQLQASGGNSYLWSPAAGLSSATSASPLATPEDSTYYRVIVSNSSACMDTAYVQVNVHASPRAYAGPDQVIEEGQGTVLQANVTGSASTWSWSPDYFISDINAMRPLVSPPGDTSYILHVRSLLGCADASDTVRIRVLKHIVVPNVFTPNGDGVNDLWTIRGLEAYPLQQVQVYNSYGQLVFQSSNFSSWNGSYRNKPLPVGTYYYLISVPERPLIKGYVDILR